MWLSKCPPLFENFHFATSFSWTIYCTCSCYLKGIQKFHENFRVCFSGSQAIAEAAPTLSRVAPSSVFPRNYTQCLSIELHFELWLSVSVLYLDLFCASLNKMCPKGDKKKYLREVIFGVLECSKSYPYKLMVIASFSAILAYKGFHRNECSISGEWGHLY